MLKGLTAGILCELQAIKSPHGAGVLSVIIFIISSYSVKWYNLTQAELLNFIIVINSLIRLILLLTGGQTGLTPLSW